MKRYSAKQFLEDVGKDVQAFAEDLKVLKKAHNTKWTTGQIYHEAKLSIVDDFGNVYHVSCVKVPAEDN